MAYYDPITGEYKEGEDPNAPAPSPTAAIAAAAPDPKAGFVKVGSTGDQNRDNMIQAFMRGMQERSVLLNKDPSVVLDEMLDKVGPGKVMLTNMLHGAGAALLNQPFKTVRESLMDRLVEQQKIQLQKQQNDSLRLQQLLQMDTRKEVAETQVEGRLAGIKTQEEAKNFRQGRELPLKERELELKAEKLAQDFDLKWADLSEETRHNLATEGVDQRKILLDEAIHQFEKEHPKPSSGNLTESQKVSASLRISQMYDKSVAPAKNAITAFNRINASVEAGSKTGIRDYNLIYSYVTILDDMSAVREGEVGFIEAAQGLKQRILTLPERYNGKKLADETVNDIINQANSIAESFRAATDRERRRYLALADKYGLEKDLISDPFEDKAENPQDKGKTGPIEYVKDPKTGAIVPKK